MIENLIDYFYNNNALKLQLERGSHRTIVKLVFDDWRYHIVLRGDSVAFIYNDNNRRDGILYEISEDTVTFVMSTDRNSTITNLTDFINEENYFSLSIVEKQIINIEYAIKLKNIISSSHKKFNDFLDSKFKR